MVQAIESNSENDSPHPIERLKTECVVNVFNYIDYRQFLLDFYLQKKKLNHRYSYSVFAKKAGIVSPNYIKLIIIKKRNLTDRNLEGIKNACAFNNDEYAYFKLLVKHNQSKDAMIRKKYEEEISALKVTKNMKNMRLEEIDLTNLELYYSKLNLQSSLQLSASTVTETECSSLVLKINKKDFEIFKKELRKFREKMMALASNGQPSDEIVVLNLQLFPVTE